jgi:anti-anti-sigma factor
VNDVHTGPPLAVTTAPVDEKTVRIDVAGEIDLATAPRLTAALQAAIAAPAPPAEIRLDLAGVTFLDAVGVAALVQGHTAARDAGVGYSVHNPGGFVLWVLDMVGLRTALNIVPERTPA